MAPPPNPPPTTTTCAKTADFRLRLRLSAPRFWPHGRLPSPRRSPTLHTHVTVNPERSGVLSRLGEGPAALRPPPRGEDTDRAHPPPTPPHLQPAIGSSCKGPQTEAARDDRLQTSSRWNQSGEKKLPADPFSLEIPLTIIIFTHTHTRAATAQQPSDRRHQ